MAKLFRALILVDKGIFDEKIMHFSTWYYYLLIQNERTKNFYTFLLLILKIFNNFFYGF